MKNIRKETEQIDIYCKLKGRLDDRIFDHYNINPVNLDVPFPKLYGSINGTFVLMVHQRIFWDLRAVVNNKVFENKVRHED